jgi:pimeloyl-ACP methyl ester carboxylesterase
VDLTPEPTAVKRFETWDGLRIAYQEWGEGAAGGGKGITGHESAGPASPPAEQAALPPVVLHHGFVANADANWVATGVVEALTSAGRKVIAPDARGHGRSEKPHDPARYGEDRMARDLGVLLDTIDVPLLDLVGYSMGAIVSLIFASTDQRVRRLVIGGVGSGVIECGGVDRRAVPNDAIIEALTVDDPSSLEVMPAAAAFRQLADALEGDRKALVAQSRSIYRGEIALGEISAPTLLLAGDTDPLAIRPQVLADAIPGGTLELLSGNHIEVLGDPRFKRAIVEFLARV